MGRVETLDGSGLVKPGRRLEKQDSMKAMKETHYALKWVGRSSPDRNGVVATDVNPTRQQSQKADTGHRSKNSNSIVKPREIPSLRTRVQQISQEQLPEAGSTAGRFSEQNSKKNEDDAFEHFKKEFVAKLAEKAKERPGYLQANEDFAKPVKAQHKLFKQSDGDFVKAVKEHSKQSTRSDEDFGKTLKAHPMPFYQTESLDQPSSISGSPNSSKDVLERTVKIIESSKTILRSSSLEKRKSSPLIHEKSTGSIWMSKSEKFNLDHDKRPWSSDKDIEETSKEFILNKFFQSPTRRQSGSVYNVYATEGESETPRAFSLRTRVLPTEHNAAQHTKSVRQCVHTFDEKQNLGRMTLDTEKYRESQGSQSGELLPDRVMQIRREMSRTELGSPVRRSSSEDRRKDLSGSVGRLTSEDRRRASSRSPGRKLLSEERRKDSSQVSTRSIGGVFPADDLRTRDHDATGVLNETQTQDNQPELKGTVSPDNGSQRESVRKEKAAMLKKAKKAAAVDQAHFLRALQDNGTVQSSSPISKDMGYSGANDATPQRPSSPNRTKNSELRPSSPNRIKISDNLKEARGNYRVDAPSRDFQSEARVDVPLREFLTKEREIQSREPSPKARREQPSSTGWKEAASYGSCGSPTVGLRTSSLRRSQSMDSPSEKRSQPSNGEIQRRGSGERSQLPSGYDSPSCASPRLSRQSSFRSSGTDESESVSGGSVIERLMKKASLRSSLSNTENETISSSVPASPKHRSAPPSSSVPASPNHRSAPPPSSDLRSLRRTLSFDSNPDISSRPQPESPREIRAASPPRSGGKYRRSSSDSQISDELHGLLSERKSALSRVTSMLDESAVPGPAAQHPLSNSLRVNVQVKESTIAKLKSRSSTSPVVPDSQKFAAVKTVEEPCLPIATPERTISPVSSGGSCSPGSDYSGSDASGTEQPSPVSVLSYNNQRTPFQEDSRLSPLEHKIQVLHDRIRKSKIDVTNQKKARLEKVKAREAELRLSVVTQLTIDEFVEVSEEVPPVVKTPQLLLLPFAYDVEEKKKPFASVNGVARDEKLVKARPAGQILDFCTSLETFDLKSISPWREDKKWDLVYIRDVLLVSNFGRDRSSMTKWHSITEPMDPCLYDDLEEFYKIGKKFSGSQFLSTLAASKEDRHHQNMQEYVQRLFLNPATRNRAAVDSINRCHLFDVVNETLAKKLVPYVALPRPWMKPLAKPVVRPRPTGSALMQQIWADIYDQIGNNGSMLMDKAQLHRSLEDLISEDLFKRTDLFPCREIERSVERVGVELERRILDDLLFETISSLRKFARKL